ncbi:MAG TPA: trypsin-like peptidase domain-containing protein [Candidatus Dormibacteraeota bacterium]|nr:trypsin-like peptidase domain-containing protein [Candidatus Dormibacteraeota bacterium]
MAFHVCQDVRAAMLLGTVVFVAFACNSPFASTSSGPSTSAGVQAAYTSVVNAVSPSIVLIETSSGLGSGVVLNEQGDIVTNAHVLGSASSFRVTSADGKQYPATLVGAYVPSDLAVIKTSATGLRPALWADSSKLQVGLMVLAMGNPLGFESSVTEGIVSGLGRTVTEPDGAILANLVQTSAAINPGNSGGGLVDLHDQVVGMPTLGAVDPQMGAAAPGIGFALPSNTVTDYANQIVKNGRVVNTRRAYLGVQLGDVTGSGGAVVLGFASNSPARSGGVQVGDIITSIDGQPIGSSTALDERLAGLAPGDTATLAIKRNGQGLSVKVTLGTLPAQ